MTTFKQGISALLLTVCLFLSVEHEVTTSSVGQAGFILVDLSVLNLFKQKDLQVCFKHMRNWCAYQLGFKRKDIFDMDWTEGTLMITVLMILASLALGLRQYPNSGVPNPKGLRSLLTDIFSGTSCECFEEGYSQLRLPILGSTSIVPWNNCASVCVASKF